MKRRKRLGTKLRPGKPTLTAKAKGRSQRTRVLIIALFLLLLAGALVQRYPIALSPEELPDNDERFTVEQAVGDVLLIDTPSLQNASASVEDMPFGGYWHNVLAREFGPYRVVSVANLAPGDLEHVSLVVVPAGASSRFGPSEVGWLHTWVERGGTLLVERPGAVWEGLLGVAPAGTEARPARRITAFDGARISGDLRTAVIQMPMFAALDPIHVASVRSVEGLQVLLEIDGLPGLMRRDVGRGEVFALTFDFSRAVGSIEQGLPAADWEIARPSASLPPGFTRTASLLADSELGMKLTPTTDLLQRNVMNVVTANRPMVRVWRFPEGRPGAFVMTHSGLPSVTEGVFMTDFEAAQEWPTTTFRHAAEEDAERETNAVLLYPPMAQGSPVTRFGLLGFRPFVRPLGFAEQVRDVVPPQTSGEIILSRLAEGLWDPDYGATFRQLDALGVSVDSSYGPALAATDLEAVQGYSFGTGLPFHPLDRRGRPHRVLEVPVVLNDGDQFDPDTAQLVIEEAATRYNQLVVADWRSGTMQVQPRADVVQSWRASLDWARENHLWVTDLETFTRFWSARQRVALTSTFEQSGRRLTADLETPPIELDNETRFVSVAFESTYEGRPIERMTRNGEDVPFSELSETADGVQLIYTPPPGTNRLEIIYQGPIQLEAPIE
ncbi:MAG: hypothetical protein KC561_05005 [Myxococcales bacterium]|nr:hypothetical protein [Myxococcales bacterium]